MLGANGAGKTTTIAMILGLLLPSAGRVRIFGRDMATDRYALLPRMNFSSPYTDLPHRLTVRENLTVYARLYGLDERAPADRAHGRDPRPRRFPEEGPPASSRPGQRTRVALAKALLNDPELLLLDEPSASLDPDTADWVRGVIERYRGETGATILLASHNMAEVERLCDDVFVMSGGRIVGKRHALAAMIERHGLGTLEEVFLEIVRGTARSRRGGAVTASDTLRTVPAVATGLRSGRIGALVLRHTYLLRRSWPRLLELTYWPTVQMIIWGLVTMFLITNSSWFAQAAGVLLAGVILWDVMFRGQIGLSLVFIEEMWSRNLGHLFVSPAAARGS